MEPNFEQCPLCGTELSRVKFREIEAKLRQQEQEKAAELKRAGLAARQEIEQRFKQDLERERQLAAKKAREEAEGSVKKIATERDLATRKLKEAEVKELEIRKNAQQELAKQKLAMERKAKEAADEREKQAAAERDQLSKKLKAAQDRQIEIQKYAEDEITKHKQAAEKKANELAEVRIKSVVAERDQISKKLKEAQGREAEILKQTQQEAEKQRQKDLAEQRQALETDKNLSLLKQESKFKRDRESLQKKVQVLERQLQNKTANELGDGAEIDLFEALREAFPGDKIVRVPKGTAGADILHEVLYKGESCGKIVVDSKNRQSWQNAFVSKLRQDQIQAGAEHAILATTVFPAGKKEMCIEGNVIVMAPARIVYVVELLRQAMVTMHIKGLSIKERETKMTRLYKLITSEVYSSKFAEANKLTQEILDLEVQEQTAHGNVWKRRGALLKRIHNVLREAETEVAAIVEADDGPGAFSVKSIRTIAASASTRSEGIL